MMLSSAISSGATTVAHSSRLVQRCPCVVYPRPPTYLKSPAGLPSRQRKGYCKPGTAAAAAQEQPPLPEQQPEAAAATAAETPLQAFLRWLLANGVQGVGAADSKVGLYEGEGGERGVVCMQPIVAGEVIMCMPMRLAVADHSGQEEEEGEEAGDGFGLEERPWSVRLAGKLLGMVQQGASCPWHPYLQVLPKVVPSPLTTFSWQDVQAIEYEPMRRQLDHASWLASSASQQGGSSSFSREQWDWALSVVHSRTFGAPGASSAGGVGVRMLVPLVDMLNHAGDYTTGPPGAATSPPAMQAFDNVRWDLKAPRSSEGEWEMAVSATRDIAAGQELLLSYGERSNDDFFLHYGFVPPRNPHDDVALFGDIEGAIDWWLDTFLPPGVLPPQRLQALINAAYDAAEQQEGSTAAAEAVLAAVPEAEADVIRAELSRIKLSAGGMVDGRLLAAYRSLYETATPAVAAASLAAAAAADATQEQAQPAGPAAASSLGSSWEQHMRKAVGLRCQELLLSMPTPLLQDLQHLAALEQQTGEQQHCWSAAQQHYAAAVAAYEAQHGSLQAEGSASSGEAGASSAGGPDTPDAVMNPSSSSGSDAGAAPLIDAGADPALAQLLLAQAKQQQAAAAAGNEQADGSSNTNSSSPGSGSSLPLQYRCYKKMTLWDALLLSAQ